MANTLLPPEERILSPEEVGALDRRRRRGQLLLVLGFQFGIVATLTLLWSGQDATYSPGWAHPMVYWNVLTGGMSLVCFAAGLRLRRGMNEFFSY
jgi:hypothetical protein